MFAPLFWYDMREQYALVSSMPKRPRFFNFNQLETVAWNLWWRCLCSPSYRKLQKKRSNCVLRVLIFCWRLRCSHVGLAGCLTGICRKRAFVSLHDGHYHHLDCWHWQGRCAHDTLVRPLESKHKLLCTFKAYANESYQCRFTRRVVRHGKQQTWCSYYALYVRNETLTPESPVHFIHNFQKDVQSLSDLICALSPKPNYKCDPKSRCVACACVYTCVRT